MSAGSPVPMADALQKYLIKYKKKNVEKHFRRNVYHYWLEEVNTTEYNTEC